MNQERVILFCGHMRDEPFIFLEDDGCYKTTMSWFSILAPEIRSPSSGTAPSSSPLRTPHTLSSFAVLELPTRTFFTVVDSYIFIFHDSVNKILTFNSFGDWKLAPPMNCPRTSPHIIVQDGKLYVIGGLIHPIGGFRGWISLLRPYPFIRSKILPTSSIFLRRGWQWQWRFW